MNVLITGGTGFIGSHLADLLKVKGYNVFLSIRKSSNLRWVENKGFNLVETEFEENESNRDLFSKMDFVYHLAGVTSAKNYEGYLKGNRDLTIKVLNLTEKYSHNLKKFIFISSQTASGPAKSADNPTKESDVCNPLTSYGKSKFEAELEVLNYSDKFPICIIRPPAVFGPRDAEIFSIFKAVKLGIGTLIGFNKKLVSLIYVEDLVEGILLAGESSQTIGNTYFISSEKFYSWDYLLNEMKNAFGKRVLLKIKLPHSLVLFVALISELLGKFSKKPPVFNYEKGIDFIQNYWICSIEKAKKDFGFSPKNSIQSGFKKTISWYRENNWL